MGSTSPVDDRIDAQLLGEMTKLPPSPHIKNIMVTGGNGFMYVLGYLLSPEAGAIFSFNHYFALYQPKVLP